MFNRYKRIHFVGIGGIGMSGIAEILYNLKYEVSGSDLQHSSITKRLKRLGIKVYKGHRGFHVHDRHLVVKSTAVQKNNPEIQEALKLGIPVIARAEMLAELMRLKYGVAISGTHGKTTTTSLIGTLLKGAGFDPTVIIGGRVKSLRSNAKVGRGEYLVAEADESDGSFLNLSPTITVVTNIDREHMDHYKDFSALKEAFLNFANKVPFYGFSVLCTDHPEVRALAKHCAKRVITYGLKGRPDITARKIIHDGAKIHFEVLWRKKKLGTMTLPMMGLHNVQNALAAIVIALELGVPFSKIRGELRHFKGIGRRMEVLYNKEVTLMDDYGHHPVEIGATLSAIKEAFPGRRRFVLFQPHRYSRTADLFKLFPPAFKLASEVWLAPIYAAGEEPIRGITSGTLARAIECTGIPTHLIEKNEVLAEKVYDMIHKNDIILILGAGDIWKTGKNLAQLFKKRGFESKGTRI